MPYNGPLTAPGCRSASTCVRIEVRVRVDVYVRVDVRARVFIGRHACVVHLHELLGGHELRLQRLLKLLNGRFDELEPCRSDAAFVGDDGPCQCGTEKNATTARVRSNRFM